MVISKSESKIFYIIRLPDQPLVLDKATAIIMGRSDVNDLIIQETRVSRRHAKIEWLDEEKSFVIKDLQSLNGSYLNGKKIPANQHITLKDWDKIRIASTIYTFREDYRSNLGLEFSEIQHGDLDEATQFMSNNDLNTEEDKPAFSGSLASLCPVELVQMMQASSNTGILNISTSDKEGEFTVLDGQIIKAKFGNKTAQEAVFQFFHYNYGTFTFYNKNDIAKNREIQASTNSLIMQGCQILDETNNK